MRPGRWDIRRSCWITTSVYFGKVADFGAAYPDGSTVAKLIAEANTKEECGVRTGLDKPGSRRIDEGLAGRRASASPAGVQAGGHLQ